MTMKRTSRRPEVVLEVVQVAVGDVGEVDAHLVVVTTLTSGRGQLDLPAAAGDADGDEQRAAQVAEGGGAGHGLQRARDARGPGALGGVGPQRSGWSARPARSGLLTARRPGQQRS